MSKTKSSTVGSGGKKVVEDVFKKFLVETIDSMKVMGEELKKLAHGVDGVIPRITDIHSKIEEVSKVKPMIENNHGVVSDTARKTEALEHKISHMQASVDSNHCMLSEIIHEITSFLPKVEAEHKNLFDRILQARSEERRVGKECRL